MDRPAREGDKFDEAVIEVTESREEPVVGKQKRIVEEIIVGKEGKDRTETVRDTVRRQDVEVEDKDIPRNRRRLSSD